MSTPAAIAIIPARYGSTRFPGKPLAEINGKPMIQHVYERVREADLVGSVIVATDDERIAGRVREFGGHAVMTPTTLQSGSDRIAFVAASLSEAKIIVNVQGDEPLIDPGMIDEGIRILSNSPGCHVSTLVREIDTPADLDNPSTVKVVLDKDGRCLYFSRSLIPFTRDIAPGERLQRHTFYKHIGLYVYRREFLIQFAAMQPSPLEEVEQLEQLRILENGFSILAGVTTHDSLPVDTPSDLELVRTRLKGTS